MNKIRVTFLIFLVFPPFFLIAQMRLSSFVIIQDGITFTVTPTIQNENSDTSDIYILLKVENNSDRAIYLSKIGRGFQIGNRFLNAFGLYGHSISEGELIMELDRIGTGENLEKSIIAKNISMSNVTRISFSFDYLTCKNQRKAKNNPTITITSKEYKKKANRIFASCVK